MMFKKFKSNFVSLFSTNFVYRPWPRGIRTDLSTVSAPGPSSSVMFMLLSTRGIFLGNLWPGSMISLLRFFVVTNDESEEVMINDVVVVVVVVVVVTVVVDVVVVLVVDDVVVKVVVVEEVAVVIFGEVVEIREDVVVVEEYDIVLVVVVVWVDTDTGTRLVILGTELFCGILYVISDLEIDASPFDISIYIFSLSDA